MNKEELLKELEYIDNVIKGLRPNDSDASFYYYQRDAVEKQLKEMESDEDAKGEI